MDERIVFFGRNKDYKITQICFNELLKYIGPTSHQVVMAVVSDDNHNAADTLEAIAKKRGVHWLSAEYNDINHADFIAKLAKLRPTLFIVVQFPGLFKDDLLSLPERGALNLHRGWPFRGGSIDERAIYYKLPVYYVILHHLNSGIDSGNIIGKIGFRLSNKEDGYSLVQKNDKAGREVFLRYFLPLIGNPISKGEKQNIKDTVYGAKGSLSNKIDLSKSSGDIERLCRAFNHPRKSGVFLKIKGESVCLLPPIKVISAAGTGKPGTVLDLNKSSAILITGDSGIKVRKCRGNNNKVEFFGAFLIRKGIKVGDRISA